MTFVDFFSGFSLGATLLIIVGILFLIAELFTPGIGITGVISAVCFLVAVILRGRQSVMAAIWLTAFILVLCAIFIFLLFRSASKGAFSKSPIVLNETINSNASYISSEDLDYYVGKRGVAQSALRPSGIVNIEGARINVVTDGEYIERGSEITVDRIDGIRLIVKQYSK